MTDDQRTALLTMLKYNLDIITDYMDAEAKEQKESQLLNYINASVEFITRQGITLDYSAIGDLMLITMYAQYLYDKRMDGVSVMPRALRYELNNRVFQEKVNDA